MKSFFRSVKYILPYKGRLIGSLICVLLIAVLWSGGIAMALPGLKVMLSPEGLHGWTWSSLTNDKLEGTFVVRDVPPMYTDSLSTAPSKAGAPKPPTLPAFIIDIVTLKNETPTPGGLVKNRWIVGTVDDAGVPHLKNGKILQRELAKSDAKTIKLYLYDRNETDANKRFSTATVTCGEIKTMSSALQYACNDFLPYFGIEEPKDKAGRFPILFFILLLAGVATILRNILRVAQEYMVQTAVFRGIMDIRMINYEVALRLPVTFYSTDGTADTTSRFIADCAELQGGHNTLFGKTLVEPAKMLGSAIAAYMLLPDYTLACFIAGPPVFLIVRMLGKMMRRATKSALKDRSEMLGVIDETLKGIRVVKAYTMEATERKRFRAVIKKLYKQMKKIALIDSSSSPLVETIGLSVALVVAGIAGREVLMDRLDPELFLTWMMMLAAVFDPLRKLSKVATRFQRADAAAERVFELMDREQEKHLPAAESLPIHADSIEFKNVTYTYPEKDEPILKDISFTVEQGKSFAIVGPNGCGKTTLLSLLPRLMEVDSGTITIDGKDIATHSLRSLRRQIGIVTQETVLFNATIAENISYGLRHPNPDAVQAAADKAFVTDFAMEMADGLDTMVTPRGGTLSGGQRQRIAIARAILRDPSILIFDEALSQIDPESEQKITEAMGEFVQGRTTFMIAHRFQTILASDAIIVMDDGRIVDIGAHSELLERCSLYQTLYNTQFAHVQDN
ncbi:MAG: ABC transporter ATP-binding protein [Phycisphaerales bacterium]|jgi:ATP-binding cassette, subfamily B, bacterial MsbA|nr:ABC transporter ATP-binding protein [Phycisphaerales bacterium]MBT7170388.1 ABC transporter ATP-binding protein [Phycisphaerales bacterium]